MKNKLTIKNLSILLFSFWLILLYLVFLFNSTDNDMFFEIMSGRDILNGNFHTISHANNFPIVVQQWLYAVCLAIVDKYGNIGYMLFVFIQDLILIILSYIFIYNRTHNKYKAIYGPICAILYCQIYMINIRPQIITVICLVSQLIFLDLWKKKNLIKYLFFIFPILILSANMHQAVFLYHGFVMVPYFIQLKKPYIDWKLILFTPFYIACSLLTPYGLDGSLYVYRTFKSHVFDFIHIEEIQPMPILSVYGVGMLLLVGITIYLIYKRKANIFITYYVFTIFILALTNIRHISIQYIPILFLICILDFSWVTTYCYNISTLLLIALCMIFSQRNDKYHFDQIENSIKDKDALIFNSALDVGGWLEYNGCTKVKLDSRCEAYSQELSGISGVIEDYYLLRYGYIINIDTKDCQLADDDLILDLITDYQYLVVNNTDYVNRIVEHTDNWNKIYSSKYYTVWQNVN